MRNASKNIFLLLSIFLGSTFFVLSCYAVPVLKYDISGLDNELLERITLVLEQKQKSITEYNKETIIDFYQKIPKDITRLLETVGYFHSTVMMEVPRKRENVWSCAFTVNLGQPLRISKIELSIVGEGAKDSKILQVTKDLSIRNGDIFNSEKYEETKRHLFDLAEQQGYRDASFKNKNILIDLKKNIVIITLCFDTGPQYYFGNTTFKVPFFDKDFLAKFLPYSKKDIYFSKKLYELQERLNNSSFFQECFITPSFPKNRNHLVPIEVTLVPKKAKQYSMGMGFGTDTGARGSLGMEHRYITAKGHSFKGEIQASQIRSDLELQYLIPGKNPLTDMYSFNASGHRLNLKKGSSLVVQGGVGYQTVIKDWQQVMKLDLQHEHYQLVDQPYRGLWLLVPSINWLLNSSDDLIKPTKGYRINIDNRGAIKYLLSENNFFQTQLDTKYLHSFYDARIQALLHLMLGFTAINDINKLPLSLQYYTGGAQTVRGFGYEAIGPGRNLLVGSIELRHRIYGDWYLAGFFDAGDASNKLFLNPHYSVGGGIVWRSSIGTIELSYAKAVSEKGVPSKVHFRIGADL